METDTLQPPFGAPPSGGSTDHFAHRVALYYVPAPIGAGNHAVMHVLMQAVLRGFVRDAVHHGSAAGLPNPYFIFLTFAVGDRRAALRSLRATLEEHLGILPLCGLAYWCADEEIWRHVFGLRFDPGLLSTAEHLSAAQADLRSLAAIHNTFVAALNARLQQEVQL